MKRDNRNARVLECIGRSGLGAERSRYLPRLGMTGGLLEPKSREDYSREIGTDGPLKRYLSGSEKERLM